MTPPPHVPPGLSELQAQFAAMLRCPLRVRDGTLRSEASDYGDALVAALEDAPHAGRAAGIGTYHRQYWFRLFSALQSEFPLLARLLGLFDFNQLCQAYLAEHPPRHADLGCVGDAFPTWFAERDLVPHLPKRHPLRHAHAALRQALRVDEAWRSVFHAPLQPVWRPTAQQAGAMPHSRLHLAPTVALVTVDWPLVELRRGLVRDDPRESITLPKRLNTPSDWAIFRSPAGIVCWQLPRTQWLLYHACGRISLERAVAEVEASCPARDRAALDASVQRWLARSVELGFWTGMSDASAGPEQEPSA